MTSRNELIAKQDKWAKEYRNQLAESGVSLIDSQAEADRQLQVLRDIEIDPYEADDWNSPSVAATEFRRENPLQKATSLDSNPWNSMQLAGSYLGVAAIIIPLLNLMRGEFNWTMTVNGQFLVTIAFVAVLIFSLVTLQTLYLRCGVRTALIATAGCIALCASTLFIPQAIWGDALKTPFFYLPTILVSGLALLAGWLISRGSAHLSEQHKQRTLLRSFDLRKAGANDALNRDWFNALNVEIRNSYHFNSKMVTKTLTELNEHLKSLSQASPTVASAEEEFGPVADFAFELARNNHQALVNTRRFELLTSLFYLIFGIMMLVAGTLAWWQDGFSLGVLGIIFVSLGSTVLGGLAVPDNFKAWKQVHSE